MVPTWQLACLFERDAAQCRPTLNASVQVTVTQRSDEPYCSHYPLIPLNPGHSESQGCYVPISARCSSIRRPLAHMLSALENGCRSLAAKTDKAAFPRYARNYLQLSQSACARCSLGQTRLPGAAGGIHTSGGPLRDRSSPCKEKTIYTSC